MKGEESDPTATALHSDPSAQTCWRIPAIPQLWKEAGEVWTGCACLELAQRWSRLVLLSPARRGPSLRCGGCAGRTSSALALDPRAPPLLGVAHQQMGGVTLVNTKRCEAVCGLTLSIAQLFPPLLHQTPPAAGPIRFCVSAASLPLLHHPFSAARTYTHTPSAQPHPRHGDQVQRQSARSLNTSATLSPSPNTLLSGGFSF